MVSSSEIQEFRSYPQIRLVFVLGKYCGSQESVLIFWKFNTNITLILEGKLSDFREVTREDLIPSVTP